MFDFLFGKDKDKKASASTTKKSGGGSGSGPKQPKPSQAMQGLDDAIDLVEKKENMTQHKIDEELAKAKQYYAKNNKNGALQCMKRKKVYEEQLLKLGAQKQNLETQRFALENQQMNMELVEAQKKAAEELKKGNKKMDVAKIEEQQDELMDEIDKANQVSDALANPVDPNIVDEDELLDELEMELADDDHNKLADQLASTAIPSSKPSKASSGMTKEEEDAMKELEAELAAA